MYVGVTHYPKAGAGILELGTEERYDDFTTFQHDIKDNRSSCQNTGLEATYESTQGDHVTYSHGKATVNGKPWPLHGYSLYDSPYINSVLGSGLITIGSRRNGTLMLDFRDPNRPIRIVKQTEAVVTY